MKFAKGVFAVAAAYGLLSLPPQYFTESMFARLAPPALTHPEYFYGFLGVALAWQVLFVQVARDPLRLRPVMMPAILEKLGFGLAAVVLVLQGRAATMLLGFGVIDLMFAVLFAIAYVRTGRVTATAVPSRG